MKKSMKKIVSTIIRRSGAELREGPHCIGPLYQPARPVAKKAASNKEE